MSDSRLANTIVGRDATLTRVQLDGAMLGNGVVAEGLTGHRVAGRPFRGRRGAGRA